MFGGSMYGSSMYGGGVGGGYYGSGGYGGYGAGYGGLGYGGGYGTVGMPMMGGLRNRQAFAMGGAGMMHEPLPPVPGTQHAQLTAGTATAPGAYQAQQGSSSANTVPSDETAEQKRRRIKHERQLAKQQAEERQLQRRTFMMSAVMELVSHAVQILMHSIRTCYELMSIAFGAYYSIKAMRAFLDGAKPPGPVNGGNLVAEFQGASHSSSSSPVTSSPAAMVASSSGASAASTWGGRIRRVALAVALLSVAELVVKFLKQQRAHADEAGRRVYRGSSDVEYVDDETAVADESGDSVEELSTISTEEDDEEETHRDKLSLAQNTPSINAPRTRAGVQGVDAPQRRLFVARYDYETQPEDVDHLPFRTGDQLLVDDYNEKDWCVATVVNSVTGERRTGRVPGNYIQPITIPQKF